MRRKLPAVSLLLFILAGCIPSHYTVNIPALEKLAEAVVPPECPQVPTPTNPEDIIRPLDDRMTTAEWTTIITGLLSAGGIILHRYWYHWRVNGKK